jgi:hypothetical protein
MADWPYNTRNWQRLRLAKLARDPACYACGLRGCFVLAVAVDHVKAINAGGDPFPDFDGLMSLCERCHNEKTAAADRRSSYLRAEQFGRRFNGFDVNGNPVDPDDDWHGGGAMDHGECRE